MKSKNLIFLLLTLLVASTVVYAYRNNYFSSQNTYTPGPLRHFLEPVGNPLTLEGIFSETNRHRQENNKPVLTTNEILNQAAQKKLEDMATKQYFEHVSPQGQGPSDVVKSVGYEYLTVGENLALGNFKDDADLVQAWMDSPGHRANILSDKFTEIGIAAKEVTFEGKKTWLAVQEFGRPQADCPTPLPSLREQIDQQEDVLKNLSSELDTEKQKLESLSAEIKKLIAADEKEQARALYDSLQTKEDNYNKKVKQATALQQKISNSVDTLNQQIRNYNTCLK